MMTTAALVAVAQETATTAAIWPALKVGLFTNAIVMTPFLTIADLTPPTYTGYAPQTAPDLGMVYDNPIGDAVQELGALIFQPTGTTTASTIVGWYLYNDGTPDVLVRAELLENPVTLAGPLDALVIQGSWGLGQPAALPTGS